MALLYATKQLNDHMMAQHEANIVVQKNSCVYHSEASIPSKY